MKYLVTGAAGFIGAHLMARLSSSGATAIMGVDDFNDYYDPTLKRARNAALTPDVEVRHMSIHDEGAVKRLFREFNPDIVVNLAAQAGVRYSLEAPRRYVQSNLVGFVELLEACRDHGVSHLVYASSSSVYGESSSIPFRPEDPAGHPLSLYAATKRSNELLAHSYSHLFGLPTTGLRFFTVYGPWGRPDMAYSQFAEALLDERPITLYGDGSALRDLTYVADIVESVARTCQHAPVEDATWLPGQGQASSTAPWRLFNIGHGGRISVLDLIRLLERLTGREADIKHLPPQPGDVRTTQADTQALASLIDYTPSTTVEDGMALFLEWLLHWRDERPSTS